MNIMNEYFKNQPKNHLTGKLLILAVLMTITWVATMFVWGIIQERQSRQTDASNEISEQWSRPQLIAGPVLTIPVERTTIDSVGGKINSITSLTLLPKDLALSSQIDTQLLKRGVYETPVYTTTIGSSGSFDLSNLEQVPTDARILWDQAVISIHVSDSRGIATMFDFTLNGEKFKMLPASKFAALDASGVHADVKIDPKVTDYQFSFDLPLKGSREISFLPLGENTKVQLSSSWNAPSFIGEFLPESRSITENGFEATWQIPSYAKDLPQSWIGSSIISAENIVAKAFGVGLYQEVDFYTMVDRSTKYSILFIGLTFLTFFMYEVLAGLRIHPVQYLLVGMAIALFYLLLLSLAEIIGFLPAYLLAATATTGLIAGYCFTVLKANSRALTIVGLLTALYGYLYILLQMEQYSLLFGSILLFCVLGIVMFITRNLDWYKLNNTDS
ncbi:MAG: cell envelope integrity protein CreD [Candidatus Parcubacteria bacterium]|jgi:inner membrane protein